MKLKTEQNKTNLPAYLGSPASLALCIEIKLTYFGEGRKGSSHVPGEEVCISYLIFSPSKGGRLFSGLETTAGCPAARPSLPAVRPTPFCTPVTLAFWAGP